MLFPFLGLNQFVVFKISNKQEKPLNFLNYLKTRKNRDITQDVCDSFSKNINILLNRFIKSWLIFLLYLIPNAVKFPLKLDTVYTKEGKKILNNIASNK